MTTSYQEGHAFITFAQASAMSKKAGLNNGKGIHASTIRRWSLRGHAKGGFPIASHPNLPGQIDREQWAKFVGGSPAAVYESASVQREVERRRAFLGDFQS